MSETKRGFALLTPEKRREIARRGGLAAQALGRSHKFTPAEARIAGTKGGLAVSVDREHMRRIGIKGGLTIAQNREHMSRIGKKDGHVTQGSTTMAEFLGGK